MTSSSRKKAAEVVMLPLGSIRTKARRFQLRDNQENAHRAGLESRRKLEQFEDMLRAVERGVNFEPITVVVDEDAADSYIVVDGHHRLEAHRVAKRKVRGIPAIVSALSFGDARRAAQLENGKIRIQQSLKERIGATWQLYATSEELRGLPVRRLEVELNVSRGTINNFKKAYERLSAHDKAAAKADGRVMAWRDAKDIRGEEDDEEERPNIADYATQLAAWVRSSEVKALHQLKMKNPQLYKDVLRESGLEDQAQMPASLDFTTGDFEDGDGEHYEDI